MDQLQQQVSTHPLPTSHSSQLTVHIMSSVSITNDIMSMARSQLILAVNLRLPAILRRRAGPDVNVVLAVVPVADALRAGVLEDEVLLGVGVPDDFALVELAGGGGL